MLWRTRGLRVYRLIVWAIGIAAVGHVEISLAQPGLNYIDANEFNVTPTDKFRTDVPAVDQPPTTTDNIWFLRSANSSGAIAAGGNVFEASAGNGVVEDAPEMKQQVTGLTIGQWYDVYAAYWSDDDENWTIRTGVAPGSPNLYSFVRNSETLPTPGATPGVAAAAAIWDTLPPGTQLHAPFSPFREGSVSDPTDRLMLLGYAGRAQAVNDGFGSGVVDLYFDDYPSPGSPGRRTWLDGAATIQVASQAAPVTPVSLTASIDAAGVLSLSNPTSRPFQIKDFSITSSSFSLNSNNWNSITGNLDNGAGSPTFDADDWTITAPLSPATFTNTLTEEETENPINDIGGALAAGRTLNFGTVWQKTRFHDVRLEFTLSDDTLVTLIPQYAVDISPIDFDGSGTETVTDFQALLNNLHQGITFTTQAEAFKNGDVNGDRTVTAADFLQFRDLYNLGHGAGAFDQLLAQVPEPASLTLLALAGLFVAGRRRRSWYAAAVLSCCLMWTSSSQANAILKIDVNGRGNVTDNTEATPPMPIGTNTVTGFSEFTLTGDGSGRPSDTQIVDGYTITVTSRNAANGAAGSLDDRDRSNPRTAPTLNQIYDDFVFATSVGIGGGMDLEVSGGALAPNRPYTVALYSYDPDTTGGRTSHWLDANDSNRNVLTHFFDGTLRPSVDDQYKPYGVAMTDGSGKLFLRGRSGQPTNTNAVFLNGFEIDPRVLTLEVNTSDGTTRILNEQSDTVNLTYYEIRSASGSLKPAGPDSWISLDDAEAGADPIGSGWDEVPASNFTRLAEVRASGATAVDSVTTLSLGKAFNPFGQPDLSFFYGSPGDLSSLRAGLIKYVSGSVPGDYNNNGSVDAADYVLWRNGGPLQNEVDAPGTVNAADYTAWRTRFGNPGPGSSLGDANVPEPASMTLVAMSFWIATSAFRRARAVQRNMQWHGTENL